MSDLGGNAPTLLVEQTGGGEQAEVTLPMRPAPPEVSPGLRRGDVLGRYVIVDVLGEGGMGVVYAAFDPELDRKVAIKLVKYASSSGEQTAGRTRLVREAQALARLTHPNIVAVYDVGTWKQAVFVAMEFVEGQTVSRWMEHHHEQPAPGWAEVLSVMIPAGRGLAAAHAAGIVHRDFKPENVMISETGRVLVLDFGLARATEGGPESLSAPHVSLDTSLRSGSMMTKLTATGSVMGTPAYMAPEQLGAGLSDEASDQFSFCVSLYHALYGSRPFAGKTLPDLSESLLSGEIEAPPQDSTVPAWLRRVVLKGLSVAPADRYASMDELLVALSHDPGKVRRRALWASGAAVALVGSWLGASLMASPKDSCGQADAAMRQAWGPPQREALEQAFRHEARTYSEQSIERVEEALEGYATTWVEQRRAACEAGQAVGTDAARDAGLQAACLDQRLRRFDALVRLFGDADQAMVAKALTAVQQLPEPSRCQDTEAFRQAVPMPDDPAVQETVEGIRLRMAEVHALAVTGRLKEADEKVVVLLAEARGVGFEPLVAEVLRMKGGTDVQLGRYAQGRTALEEGVRLSRAHGLEWLELELLSPLSYLHLTYTNNYEMAEWLAQIRQVLVERVDPRPEQRARVLLDRGRLEFRRGRYAESIEQYEKSIALLEQSEVGGFNLVLAHDQLATSYMEADRTDDAARVLKKAEEIAATALGADHPHRGNLMVHFARVEAARGEHARAVERLEAALTIFEGAYGKFHPNNFAVLNGLGLQLEVLGRPDDAVVSFRRAEELATRSMGEQHAQVAIIHANLGNTLRRQGDAAEALRLHRLAQKTRDRIEVEPTQRYELLDNIGDDLRVLGRCDEAVVEYRAANRLRDEAGRGNAPEAAYPRVGTGLCQWRTEGPRVARPTLEGALMQAEGDPDDPSWSREALAVARFSLALVLRDAEPESARARALAEQARAFWAEDPTQFSVLLGELKAWQAGEPVTMPTY